jgi:CheY-like chemotaxis protein
MPTLTLGLIGISILAVEDDPDAQELLKRLLSCGAKVTVSSSATEALDLIQRLRPDLLLCDIEMPRQDDMLCFVDQANAFC